MDRAARERRNRVRNRFNAAAARQLPPARRANDGGRCLHRPPLSRGFLATREGSASAPWAGRVRRALRPRLFPSGSPALALLPPRAPSAQARYRYPALAFPGALPEGQGSGWTVRKVGSALTCAAASRFFLARPAGTGFRSSRHRRRISPRRQMRNNRFAGGPRYVNIPMPERGARSGWRSLRGSSSSAGSCTRWAWTAGAPGGSRGCCSPPRS